MLSMQRVLLRSSGVERTHAAAVQAQRPRVRRTRSQQLTRRAVVGLPREARAGSWVGVGGEAFIPQGNVGARNHPGMPCAPRRRAKLHAPKRARILPRLPQCLSQENERASWPLGACRQRASTATTLQSPYHIDSKHSTSRRLSFRSRPRRRSPAASPCAPAATPACAPPSSPEVAAPGEPAAFTRAGLLQMERRRKKGQHRTVRTGG